mmetsp:Transcript_1169/g.1899  ORF Transcript_1169/g.1899 Transcript_1169/m.1899 type:complete len:426 (+) Transcript_1169:137-1414(+)
METSRLNKRSFLRSGRADSTDYEDSKYGSMSLAPSDYYESKSNKSAKYRKQISLPTERDTYDVDDGNVTDEGVYIDRYNDKLSRTGRQRKKQTARTKGGEFEAQRKKRRIYFCCVATEIHLQDLYEHISIAIVNSKSTWKTKRYGDALCISRIPSRKTGGDIEEDTTWVNSQPPPTNSDLAMKISDPGNQEIYVFEFGAVVFWGFAKGEEVFMLDIVRDFVKQGKVNDDEFASGEDDMAFITSDDYESHPRIAIANDVITLPETTNAKQRLSVSVAIAQSSVISIFEDRIERKVEEYKFIPETLARVGKIDLSIRRVGMMIGDIFVIRHDLNLHSDVLDTPDFFWEEDTYEPDYLVVAKYLEMESRVEVLNTRLDMLKELLDMIQQQMQNAHASKLEWIVIWLIVIEVVIEVVGGGGSLMGWWSW